MIKKRPLYLYETLAALFITTLIVSNVASVKLVGIGPVIFDAGTVLFPLAYIVGDIVTEVYGFRRMRALLYIGIGMLLLTTLTFWVVGLLPNAADWAGQAAYEQTLGVVWRIVLASCTAIFVGEFINSYLLARWKVQTKGAYLWRRVIGSSAVGGLLDTVAFSVIAFAGTVSVSTLMSLIITVYVIKLGVEILASPLTIRVIDYIKRLERLDTYETPNLSLTR